MLCDWQAKLESHLLCFISRLLNLLLCEWKMYQLESKMEAKDVLCFKVDGCDYSYQIFADLREPAKT